MTLRGRSFSFQFASTCLLLALLVSSCSGLWLRRSKESIREDLLVKMPLGSTREEVVRLATESRFAPQGPPPMEPEQHEEWRRRGNLRFILGKYKELGCFFGGTVVLGAFYFDATGRLERLEVTKEYDAL